MPDNRPMKSGREEGPADAYLAERRTMVERQIRRRGIDDPRVLATMAKIPRHEFVPPNLWHEAYADYPLPIGDGQTISQPYIVAMMTAALSPAATDKVLEIGTGSGYQTAILAELTHTVFTIERSASLSHAARQRLNRLGYKNVHFSIGDGTIGLSQSAPFSKILATGSLPAIPQGLLDQLSEEGILVAPVGGRSLQQLLRLQRTGSTFKEQDLGACCFVPLIGKAGWRS
jgi:protein-L-isoaspartate(D-aspartate) O-methyltransferase